MRLGGGVMKVHDAHDPQFKGQALRLILAALMEAWDDGMAGLFLQYPNFSILGARFGYPVVA